MDDAAQLPERTKWIWAKTNYWGRSHITRWLPLYQHLEDTSAVAGKLWDEWLPEPLREAVITAMGSPEQARALVRYLAGIHDVGKATPAFAIGDERLAQAMKDRGFPFKSKEHYVNRRELRHEKAGHVIVRRFFAALGWDIVTEIDPFAGVISAHHGTTVSLTQLRDSLVPPDFIGSESIWTESQWALMSWMIQRSGIDLETLRTARIPEDLQTRLSGIVIVADWIASNESYFPLALLDQQPSVDPQRLERGWNALALPRPWRASDSGQTPDGLLQSRFFADAAAGTSFPARPVQRSALEVARTCDVPGVVIIEAPMGEGKTEAALLAAEILAARRGLSGVFVGLPTQATTNAMFERVLDWLAELPDTSVSEDARNQLDRRAQHAVALAHGKAWLNPSFRNIPGNDGSFSSMHGADATSMEPINRTGGDMAHTRRVEPYVHRWMTDRRRTPLADFVVGTIDQFLFLALQSKYLSLRHLGFASKVVILDEIHSYDVYMGNYLKRALRWMGAYGVPVVMLSATLPPRLRTELLDAYKSGLRSTNAPGKPKKSATSTLDQDLPPWKRKKLAAAVLESSAADLASESSALAQSSDADGELVYPAITTFQGGVATTIRIPRSDRRSDVALEVAADDDETLLRLLEGSLADGGCVAIIRNTVSRAQATYRFLQEHFEPNELTLNHSRFLAVDRAARDAWLVDSFGPPGEFTARPQRHIVVATQVIEQSLDVDFDLLITDLAPIDLILQRTGRLHRHQRSRPAALSSPRCVITGVEDWDEAPPEFARGLTMVYSKYQLLQAAAQVLDYIQDDRLLAIPDDVAELVTTAYGAGATPPSWEPEVSAAKKSDTDRADSKKAKAATFALRNPNEATSLIDWLRWTQGDIEAASPGTAQAREEGKAQVRDSSDSVEVIVSVRSGDGNLAFPIWLREGGGSDEGEATLLNTPIPIYGEPDPEVVRLMAACTVAVMPYQLGHYDGPGSDPVDSFIAHCESNLPVAWSRIPALKYELLLVMDADPANEHHLTAVVGDRCFSYTPQTGLQVDRA